ncbi:MAG: hypothetical protein Q8K56_00075 [Rhodoglobus sp.]|nr:hypothetical protein [Rhodoglobus sp.]
MNTGNPYRIALLRIALIAAGTGFVLFVIGAAVNASALDPFAAGYSDPLGTAAGSAVIALAGFAFWLAGVAFFLWLAVSALLWRETPATGASNESTHPAHRPAPAGSKLEQIRAALDEQNGA